MLTPIVSPMLTDMKNQPEWMLSESTFPEHHYEQTRSFCCKPFCKSFPHLFTLESQEPTVSPLPDKRQDFTVQSFTPWLSKWARPSSSSWAGLYEDPFTYAQHEHRGRQPSRAQFSQWSVTKFEMICYTAAHTWSPLEHPSSFPDSLVICWALSLLMYWAGNRESASTHPATQ